MFHHGCKTYFQDWMKIVILVLTNNISPSMLGLWHAWKTFIMDFMRQNWRSCPKFNINQLRDIISERFWTYLKFRGVNLLVLILNIPLSMVIYPKISLCSIPSSQVPCLTYPQISPRPLTFPVSYLTLRDHLKYINVLFGTKICQPTIF